MICFNCGYKISSPEIKECKLCGMKFPIECTSCGSKNPVMAKFCFTCGNEINKSTIESSIQNYDTLQENRKNVAVIFADISGFTELSERMDPEEVREIINDCFNYITKPVYELDGTIDKYIGDCVMILFGAKYSHSDDPKRAVMCAMKMIQAIKDYSKEKLSSKGIELELSIGINYGLVVTGSVGNYFDKDYTVMGDVVNTAQRLQSISEKGTIYVSESIYLETKNEINYSEESEVLLKNKKKPVKYYIPKEIKMETIHDEKVLFDRENEINILNDIYDKNNFKYIKIIGQKGVGKTSLTKEFSSKRSDASKIIWIDCSQVYINKTNYVISNILFDIMNINFNDSNRIKRNRLVSFVDYILEGYKEEEIERNIDFLNFIIGLDRDNEFQNILNSMDYKDIEKELVEQLFVFFKNLCNKHNFIIVIDDTQWADNSSLNILRNLLKLFSNEKILFVFTSLYEIDELSKDGSCVLELNNLSYEGVNKFVCNLLHCDYIDEIFINEIIKLTNGNPIFIEELLKKIKKKEKYYIKNNKAHIEKSIVKLLPNTIDKLVLENISDLDDEYKKFLQIGSIIGRDFHISLVKNLFGEEFDENRIIKKIIKTDIISLKSTHTTSGVLEKIYTFNQGVVRDVIYESILNKSKIEIHKKIAEIIETKYYNEIENYYEILCIHFENANLNKKALEYYYKTALKYKEDFQFESALEYFNKFIEKYNHNEDNTDLRLIYSLKDIGYIYTVFADNEKALKYLNKALEIANLSDDIYSIKIMIANIYKEKGEYDKALEIINEIQNKIRQNNSIYGKLLQLKCNILRLTGKKEALELSRLSEDVLLRNRDYENLSETMNQAGIIYFTAGSIDNSLYYLNKAYQYAEKINNLRAMTRISGNLGIIYHASGMISKALEYFDKSINISKKILYTPTQISGSINLGILYMEKGQFDKAYELFDISVKKSRKLLFAYKECITLTNLSDLMYEIGDFDKALKYNHESIKIAKQHKLPLEESANYLGIGKVYLHLNDYEKALELLEKSYKIFEECGEIASIGDYYLYKSVYEICNNNYDKALKYCDKSIDICNEIKNDMKKLRALRLKGNILLNIGNSDEIISLYSDSIILSEQLESDYELAKGYYSRHIALYKLNHINEASEDLVMAKKTISNVGKCRWTSIIEEEKDIVYTI